MKKIGKWLRYLFCHFCVVSFQSFMENNLTSSLSIPVDHHNTKQGKQPCREQVEAGHSDHEGISHTVGARVQERGVVHDDRNLGQEEIT